MRGQGHGKVRVRGMQVLEVEEHKVQVHDKVQGHGKVREHGKVQGHGKVRVHGMLGQVGYKVQEHGKVQFLVGGHKVKELGHGRVQEHRVQVHGRLG